jgi:UDP-N-acetylglucosamine acyltransferase
MTIHPTAIVEDGARLAGDVEIGPFCVVGAAAVLGEGVRLLSHVVVTGHTEVGARTVVYAHAVLGGEAQTRRPSPSNARLIVGSDNIVREGVTMSTGSGAGSGITSVGDRCYLMAGSHVGHDCRVGNDVTLSNGVQLAGHVDVGDGVIFGGLSAVQQFSRVGRNAFISGLSGVSTDVIPYGMAIGLHVRLGGLNLIGLKRRNVPRANIHALRAAYRYIFLDASGSFQEKAQHASEKWPDVPEVQDVVNFILADPKRPICPARPRGAGDEQD